MTIRGGTSGATDEDDLVDVGLVDLRVTENLLTGSRVEWKNS